MSEEKNNPIDEMLKDIIAGQPNWLMAIYQALKREGLFRFLEVRKLFLDVAINPVAQNIKALYEAVSHLLKQTRLVLSPFPKPISGIDGPIRFALSELSLPVGIDPANDCHCLIAGATKAGKTFLLLFRIAARAIEQGIRCWVFTAADEARQLIRICTRPIIVVKVDGKVRLNPLFAPLIPVYAWVNIFADCFIQGFHIYDGSLNLLIEVLNNMTSKGLHLNLITLHRELKSLTFPLNSRNSYYRESLLNRLGSLIAGSLGETFNCIVGHTKHLLQNNVIFEISSLTRAQQAFLVNVMTIMRFYFNINNKENESSPYDFICLDDASPLFDKSFEYRADLGMPIIDQLLATVRKSRVRIFACTQMPSLLGKGIHSNSSVKIIFRLDNNEDLRCMLSTIGIISDSALIDYCKHLSERQVLVHFGAR